MTFVTAVNGQVPLCPEDDKVHGETGAIAEILFQKCGPTADY